MLNDCCIQGRLAADPELQQTQKSQKSVVSIRIACQRDTSKYAEEDSVDWINLVFWEKLAENIAKHGRKGDMIIVRGRLQSRKWEDTKRVEHITDEIYVDKFYFCTKKSREEQPPDRGDPVQNHRRRGNVQGVDVWAEDNDDGELPF